MFEHKLGYVEWLTEHFYALAERMGLRLPHTAMDHVWMAVIIVVCWIAFLAVIKKNYGVIPTRAQQVMEAYHSFVANLAKDIIGPEGAKYVPLLGTLGIFILTGNLMGLIPLFKSPTANINVTFSCAIFVFIYYHAEGIRQNGIIKYLKHFAGPVWWLAPIFIPIEVIGHFARPLSLSLRLFGNIFGEDTIIAILAGLALSGFIIPLPMMCLAVFTSLIQMLVFLMLSSVYIAGAIAHEHSQEEHGHAEDVVQATAA